MAKIVFSAPCRNRRRIYEILCLDWYKTDIPNIAIAHLALLAGSPRPDRAIIF